MLYIGIDPGVSGGIGVVDDDGAALAFKMPATLGDLNALFDRIVDRETRPMFAYVERVAAWAPAGQRMGATSAFTFGQNVGALHAFLTAYGIGFDLVTPQRWQTVMQCRTGGDKNISKARAQQLFSQIPVTHATADALLIAEYGRRLTLGHVHTSVEEISHGKETEAGKEPIRRRR